MKRAIIALSLLSLFSGWQSYAQKTGFKYDFYGFVRNDFFYSSRLSQTSEEGSFYLFPLDNISILTGKTSMDAVPSTCIICVHDSDSMSREST